MRPCGSDDYVFNLQLCNYGAQNEALLDEVGAF